jgi:hypothetical protein
MDEDNKIPMKESNVGGIPLGDGTVKGAQEALLGLMKTPKEQTSEDQEATETQEDVSEQAMDVAESVENETVESVTDDTVEESVEDNTQEEIGEPKSYTVKIDGEDVKVNEEELLAGYSRTADYTRKSQVLAEQRKKVDDELTATQQERQRLQSQLEQLSKANESEIDKLKNTDWERLKLTNQTEYLLKKDRYDDLLAQQKAIDEQTQKVEQEKADEFRKKWNESLEENKKLIVKKIPKYFDPDEGMKLQNNIREFGISEGLSNEELDAMIDARAVNILYKAMLYDQLQKTKISSKKSKVVPKVQRPGTPSTRAEVSTEKVKAHRQRLKKSGRVDDAAALIKSMMK